jgi:diketogulonate reductase-like aldo/keto reductase
VQRRNFLIFASLAGVSLPALSQPAGAPGSLTRPIPVSGERIPAIGMGTWLTFDVKPGEPVRRDLLMVLQAFFDGGGTVIDSSPMYGDAEDVVGELLPQVRGRERVFAATKVWTLGEEAGIGQMEQSRQLWRLPRVHLMQVHNLLDWNQHLKTLRRMKDAGKVRYIGVTTSHGRRHDELERIMRREPIDFVQFTYNMVDRRAEERLLPLARDLGKAVIINRPFDGGAMFAQVRGRALPAWARELGCATWSQLFLKWIVAHPAVTCAIPATSRVTHMKENMGALLGVLPDAQQRQRMVDAFSRP